VQATAVARGQQRKRFYVFSADATFHTAWAISRPEQVQQGAAYSITSSARASSCGGTSRPKALAGLRLITSSKLVGASDHAKLRVSSGSSELSDVLEAKRVLMEKLGYELKESLETAINRDAKEIEAIASKFTEDSGTRKAFRACIDDYDLAFTVLRWLALMESIWCE
jgi:hypothetical protein